MTQARRNIIGTAAMKSTPEFTVQLINCNASSPLSASLCQLPQTIFQLGSLL
jgi:hypothetical protein